MVRDMTQDNSPGRSAPALKIEMVTFDCADPTPVAQWWAEHVGGEVNEVMAGEFVILVRDAGPRLGFQKVDDPTPGKSKVHLDFAAPDLEAESGRLIAAGATKIDEHEFGPEFRWHVFKDPFGNVFCVAAGQ